jgi:hypothetical protein
MVKFKTVKAGGAVPKYLEAMIFRFGNTYLLGIVPILLGVVSLSSFDSNSKYMTLLSGGSLISIAAIQAKAVNELLLPFWFFNLSYYVFVSNYGSCWPLI